MSAPFAVIASKKNGVCFGFMSRSPSRSITYSPVEASNPALSAAPLPPFFAQTTGLTVTCSYFAAAARASASAVPSVEPSSTGTSSALRLWDSKSPAVCAMFASMVSARL